MFAIQENLSDKVDWASTEVINTTDFTELMEKWEPRDNDRLCPLTGLDMSFVFGRYDSSRCRTQSGARKCVKFYMAERQRATGDL